MLNKTKIIAVAWVAFYPLIQKALILHSTNLKSRNRAISRPSTHPAGPALVVTLTLLELGLQGTEAPKVLFFVIHTKMNGRYVPAIRDIPNL